MEYTNDTDIDEPHIAFRTAVILRRALLTEYGHIPYLNLQMPDRLLGTESDIILNVLIEGVKFANAQIFQETHPEEKGEISWFTLPEDAMRRILWRVYKLLICTPFEERDPKTGEAAFYEPLWPPFDFDQWKAENAEDDLVLQNRLAAFDWEKLQDTYDALESQIRELIGRRMDLLKAFFQTEIPEQQEEIRSYLTQCLKSLDLARRDFDFFCKKNHFADPFIPPEKEEMTPFESAIRWEEYRGQEEMLETCQPSWAEAALMHYMPKDFQRYEWSLFHFTFRSREEHKVMGTSPKDDRGFMLYVTYERKMLVAFFIMQKLHLMDRETVPNFVVHKELRILLATLEGEIEDFQRKAYRKSTDIDAHGLPEMIFGAEMTPEIPEINDLMTSTMGLIQEVDIMKAPRGILTILKEISDIFHTFFSDAVNTRTDDVLHDSDKEAIIQNYREEAIEQLLLVQKRIEWLAQPVAGSEAALVLDRADDIVIQALALLHS